MKFKYIKSISAILMLLFIATSCIKDLDLDLQDDDVVDAGVFYDNPESYKQVLAKLYAGLAVSGQEGPAGNSDIAGIDEGFGQYLRGYWQAQELCTDEAVIGWADGSLPDYHEMDWNADNEFIRAIYDRIFYQITACNEYIRQTSDAKLDGRGVSSELRTNVEYYRAEARFLRALSYFHAIDLFGNVPFVTEDDEVGFFMPEQVNRTDLFSYVESELLAIESLMVDAQQNEYARADKGVVWMLLARLYLNAEVYTGSSKYGECLTYVNKVTAQYTMTEPEYKNLFLADNHNSSDIIFPIAFDGINTQTYGGTTYLVSAPVGGSMVPSDFGIAGGWGGLRTTSTFVNKFPEPYLDLNALNATLGNDTTWGIVGSATPNGWDGPDVVLKEDGSIISIHVFLTDGEIKFRENNDWSNNLGDDGNGGLVSNGSNIAVTEGNYIISADMVGMTYSITALEPISDSRRSFHTDGQTLEIESMTTFTDGYAVVKFKNITKNGQTGQSTSYPDTDFPLFRLADAYLMYAEIAVRGAGGDLGTAVNYINSLRERAYGNSYGNITSSDLSPDFIIDERARELYWEGYRRTDLIRFGRLTGDTYLWPWKGGVAEGVSVQDYLNLYPIPNTDLNANTNLVQNTGY